MEKPIPYELTDRAKWLEERKNSIGASEAAAVLEIDGKPLSPFADARTVYEAKVNGYQVPLNHAMACGHLAEHDIAYLYEHETGRELFDPGDFTIVKSTKYDFISATPDRTISQCCAKNPALADGPGVLEMKNVNPRWYPLYLACEKVGVSS